MKSFIATLFFAGCLALTFAAPANTEGQHPSTAIELEHVLENHETIQEILTNLVRGLKDGLQDKEPAQFVPVLQNSIKKLTEILSKLKFAPLTKTVEGIRKVTQDLVEKLSASPNGGITEVNDFVEKRLQDMKNIKGSYKFIQSKLKSMVVSKPAL